MAADGMTSLSLAVGQATETQSLLEIKRARIIGSIFSQSLQDLSDQRCRFIPRDALFEAVSHTVVRDFLQFCPELGGGQQQLALPVPADNIVPADGCPCKNSHCTGGRIIFVALLALSKESIIASLFGSGQRICDADLSRLSQERCNLTEALQSLQSLSSEELGRLIHFTFQLRSPFIEGIPSEEFNTARQFTILEFDSSVSLPWTYLGQEIGDPEEQEVTRVQRVKIHSAHHNTNSLPRDLALKTFLDHQLAILVERKYRHEVQANHRTRQHERIVPLLVAFKHRDRFHLLLPWAHGGSLGDLFKKYATTTENITESDQRVATWYTEDWLLKQCLGLAEGLAAVHEINRNTQNSRTSAQIHADIKPENILCFASGDGEGGPFTLKLSDFGEAQEVNPETMDVAVDRITHTKTYRPPEHDTDNFLTLNYDVWCLGCVYLELITWAIGGLELLDSFVEVRFHEIDDVRVTTAKGNVKVDTFFKKMAEHTGRMFNPAIKVGHNTEVRFDPKGSRKAARKRHSWWLEQTGTHLKTEVKNGVREHINSLRNQCDNPSIVEFLNFINSKMIVVDPKARASSADVQSFLSRFTA